MRSRKREANAAVGFVALLGASVAVCAIVPGLEHTLNVIALWVGGAVLLIYVLLIVRDFLP